MIDRELYLKRLIDAKDTEFIKVITGVRRSGKSTLLLMYKEYLKKHGILGKNIIHINFESAMFDDIKNYKDLYKYIKDKIDSEKTYILLDEVQSCHNSETSYKDKTYTLFYKNKLYINIHSISEDKK